jgi:hypothetical protein
MRAVCLISALSKASLSLFSLRSADNSIDLSPPFNSNHFVYHAMLDYGLGSVAVDALPNPGWKITNPEDLYATHIILPAQTVRVDVKLRSEKEGMELTYTVTATRRDGTETNLRGLDILDDVRWQAAAPSIDMAVVQQVAPLVGFSPDFDPALLAYSARVGHGVEVFHVVAMPADNGQKIEFSQRPVSLVTTTTTTTSVGGTTTTSTATARVAAEPTPFPTPPPTAKADEPAAPVPAPA